MGVLYQMPLALSDGYTQKFATVLRNAFSATASAAGERQAGRPSGEHEAPPLLRGQHAARIRRRGIDGDHVVIDEMPPFSFAGMRILAN